MCGICRTVNCVRRRLFGSCGCGCNHNHNNGCDYSTTYSYNGCDDDCYRQRNTDGCYNGRYAEPRTRISCANQRNNGFTPCCEDSDCGCHKHHDDCCD